MSMKRFLVLFMALAMLLSCAGVGEETPESGLAQDLVVLFTSDVHCGVESGFGYVGLAAVRDQLAESNYVILVDNGDSIQGEPIGTMTTGESNIELMNAVGYDIAIPGNHEFDYGMDRFLELTEMAEFPYISANFNYDGELVFDPYVIQSFDGVQVAFVGITTPKTITSSTPRYFQDEEGNFIYGFFQDETGEGVYQAVQAAVDSAREAGADYVVAMAHLGDEISCSPWTSSEVIANTTGIDALLDGHAHSLLEQEAVQNAAGEDVLLVACGTKLQAIGYLRISTEGELSTGLYRWDNDVSLPELTGLENEISTAVTEATAVLEERLNEVVASTEVDLVIADPETGERIVRCAETNLGDLCADAYRAVSGADVAFVNGGGVRVAIDKGEITLNDILTVHPFGNALCMVEASGQEILDALEWGCRAMPEESGGFLQVSGLTFVVNPEIPSPCVSDENGMFTGVEGERRVSEVMVAGEPIDPEKTYTLASHNYMLKNGGDGYSMFMDNTLLLDEIMLDNQVLITYITEYLNGEIGAEYAEPYGQGRIVATTAAE